MDAEYFAVVRWCDADLEDALETMGMEVNEDTLNRLKVLCERPLEDLMVERGWDVIYDCIGQMQNES